MSTRRLLAISWYPADAPTSGERVRFRSLIEGLDAEWAVSVLSFSPAETPVSNSWEDLRAEGRAVVPYRYLPWHRAIAAVASRSVHEIVLAGRRQRRFVREAIERVQPDVILCNQLPPFSLIPREFWDATVVDTHNAEFLRVKRLAEGAPWHSKLLLLQQARVSRNLESRIVKNAAMTWAVSEADARYFRSIGSGRVEVIPNGTELCRPDDRPALPTACLRLLFVGSFNYSANRMALCEFADKWARTLADPWTLTVVGSGHLDRDTERCLEAVPQISVKGFVADIRGEYRSHDALVAPIFHGGGTRLKVLEACGNMLPVVATDVAVEGIGLRPGESYFRANNAEQAAEAFSVIRNKPEETLSIVRAARACVDSFGWESIASSAGTLLRSIISTRPED